MMEVMVTTGAFLSALPVSQVQTSNDVTPHWSGLSVFHDVAFRPVQRHSILSFTSSPPFIPRSLNTT